MERELNRFLTEQKVAGLLVLHQGSVRLERYGLNHGPKGRWVSQSVAKSMTSTLVGAAIQDGFISSIDDKVSTYIPELENSSYQHVSIRQLMTMTSGVGWNENYSDLNSDIAKFYSAPVESGFNATVSYMKQLKKEAEPGQKWVYKTGETHLLGVLVSSATGQHLADYLSTKIWASYGMEQEASWSLDRTQHELGGCCIQATLRDYARFGQFILDKGYINGQSVVPDWWFEEATRAQVKFGQHGRGYGYQWWISSNGTFQAIGIHGQLIHIDPRRKLVVAVNSAWPEAVNPQRSAAQNNLLTTITSQIDKE